MRTWGKADVEGRPGGRRSSGPPRGLQHHPPCKQRRRWHHSSSHPWLRAARNADLPALPNCDLGWADFCQACRPKREQPGLPPKRGAERSGFGRCSVVSGSHVGSKAPDSEVHAQHGGSGRGPSNSAVQPKSEPEQRNIIQPRASGAHLRAKAWLIDFGPAVNDPQNRHPVGPDSTTLGTTATQVGLFCSPGAAHLSCFHAPPCRRSDPKTRPACLGIPTFSFFASRYSSCTHARQTRGQKCHEKDIACPGFDEHACNLNSATRRS